jgi:Holliday junction resolvase
MASMKAKKGNPFERLVAYNLSKIGVISRPDSNIKGVDIIATTRYQTYAIECKFHKVFSWNKLLKIYEKTKETVDKSGEDMIPLLVFKPNQQPVMIFYYNTYYSSFMIMPLENYFGIEWESKIPQSHYTFK